MHETSLSNHCSEETVRNEETISMAQHGPHAEMVVNLEDDIASSPEEEKLKVEENSLSIVTKLRNSPDWSEVVAYGHLSESARQHSLTATTLRGQGRIGRRPLKFFNTDKTECIMIAHLGGNICGHDGIIHGGLLATLLDEQLAYVTLPHLPNYTGFTANLNVDYRLPVIADQWVMIRGKLDRVENRKAWANAWIHTIDGEKLLTEGKALYISPRNR
ncbi:HotDog domain-containing protein [Radiomyces spectabilis]|uniref:HotDog domain-containing protein n=1 Tax=Radiomyces spectabilis TaxID=64574 RepID=UPI0022201C1D|nr:HotDog domain-containing protein [Radiomyces spectabilis]KAI8371722.1 HotDog domain-containing protein [Radiomyces spectabilis]